MIIILLSWADKVVDLPRLRVTVTDNQKKARCIDYRHVINSLVRKPGAFRSSILRDDILPNKLYKDIWEQLSKQCSKTQASKLIVGILKIAADGKCEKELGEFVMSGLADKQVPGLGVLQNKYLSGQNTLPPQLTVKQHTLQEYNHLLPLGIKSF